MAENYREFNPGNEQEGRGTQNRKTENHWRDSINRITTIVAILLVFGVLCWNLSILLESRNKA